MLDYQIAGMVGMCKQTKEIAVDLTKFPHLVNLTNNVMASPAGALFAKISENPY